MVDRVLGRLLWKGMMDRAEVIILHRGAPGDRKAVKGSQIREVKKSFLVTDSAEGEAVIPLHRVMEVRLDGKPVWKRAGKA
jgi:uncharacterized protein (UPF0248 family)